MHVEAHLFDHQGNRKYLNRAERMAFARQSGRDKNLSDRAFCLMLFYTGCRISERLSLTEQRIDLGGEIYNR